MSDPSIATSADYADALIVARRAKHWLFLLLMLMLLIQLALFFTARYTTLIVSDLPGATTHPVATSSAMDKLHYLTGVTTFLGTVLPVLLSLVLLLVVNIMLVGRLIGVARVTSAYLWCLVLALLLFPWQAFLGKVTFYSADFRIPGVLYTWDELASQARFAASQPEVAILKWSRFVVFPLIALVILMMVQAKSNRGMRQAMGQSDPDLNITP